MSTRLELPNGYYLSNIAHGDEDALVTHFADGTISEMIPAIPFPYRRQHADSWVRHRASLARQSSPESTFAIRRSDGFLVGSVGVEHIRRDEQNAAQFGY